MQKKVLSMILVLCMLLGLFPYTVLGTAAANSSAEYTVISTADELIALMGDSSRWSGNYRLGDNIDLTGKTGQARIGDNTTAFTGIFDGNGKTVSGIDLTITGSTAVGFFGVIMNAEIRNLTVAGKVSAKGGKNFTGGLIGIISGQATVENCVSNITVTAVSRVGGLVGGIVLNSATTVGVPVETGACSVTISGCVNNASVTGSSSRVGGIVGSASIGAAAGRSITIENCTNNGAVKGTTAVGGVVGYTDPLTSDGVMTVSGCANTATITGTQSSKTWVGGIVGYSSPKNGGVARVVGCRNDGTIKGPSQIGGIVAYAYYVGTTVSECYNTGNVTATAADAGGILGIAFTGNVDNCINTGAVSGTESIGGIVGRTLTDSTYKACSVTCNYNAGTTTASNSKNVAAITGCKAGTVTYENNYYSAGDADETGGTAIAEADLGNSSKYVGFDATVWTFTTTGPELTVFHEHVDANGDGSCDSCGFNASCTHPTTELEVLTPATCATTGVGRETCTVCGNIEEVVLPINPDNHASELTLSLVDGKIVYTCVCGVTYAETTDPVTTVYVAANGVKALPTATAGTSENPFGNFDFAMQYAGLMASANGAATVVIKDSITVPATYETPAYTGMVTVTGGTMVLGGASTFKMNGAMTFRDINFDVDKAGIGAYLYAQNHKLVMDTGIKMINAGTVSKSDMTINAVKMYVVGGFEREATVTDTLNTDVTVRSGEYWFVGGGSRCTSGTMTVEGTTKVTLGTVNNTDTLKSAWLNTFSIGAEHVGETGLKGTMVFDGVIDVVAYNIVSQNGGGAEYDRTVDIVLMGDINPNYGSAVDVTGSTTVKGCAVDVYVDERVDTAVADADVFYGNSADSSLATLELVVNKYTYAQYCVNYLNGHVDADTNDACDICGASMQCDHPDAALEYRTIVKATCSTEGSQEVWCTKCGKQLPNVTLDKDPAIHTGLQYQYNETNKNYDLVCTACHEIIFEGLEAPVVYLDNWQKVGSGAGLTEDVGLDTNFGTDAGEPVFTLEEAVRRLAVTGGTVYFLDRYVIDADLELPAYEKEITFTTPVDTSTGFVITKHGALLSLGGPTKFEKFIFNGGSSAQNPSDKGYYNTLVIEGNWNDVTFGEALATFGNAYFIAGEQYPEADDTEAKNVNLVFTKTIANKVSDKQAAVTFFDRIYLGSRVKETGITVANKTVTADFVGGTTAINIYAGTTSTTAQNAQMVNCSTTMNFYANAYIQYIRSGDGNTAGAGTAYLDNLTVNLYDSSRIMAAFVPRNVRNLTLNISGTEDGRTLYNPKQFGLIELSSGYLASENYTGNETLTMNYTTHSFAAGVAAPSYSEQYTVTSNVVDECVWNDGEITTPATPEADGVKTYTCTVCGATKTESVPFNCTDHNYIVKADGTYYCTVCSATFTELPVSELTLVAAPATYTDGKAIVNLKLTSDAFWGVRFKVTAPEGFTLDSVVSTLPEAAEGDGTGTGLSFIRDGESMAILGFSTNPVNTALDQVVLTLTYTVADTVDTSVAQIVDVDIVEAVKVGEGEIADVEIAATAVGAEVTAAAHTHEYTSEVTKEATCGEDGVRTYTCTCGDSYTEAIPATGKHTFGEWVETTPAQPGVAGEETRTCTVCGATETRATDPLPEVPETYAAYIGDVGYATVQAAMDAAKALDTITVEADVVETVTPKTTVYLAGDYSGITVSGEYTLDVTGRYMRSGNAIVEDTIVKYTPAAVMAIVRPNAVTENSAILSKQTLVLKSSVEYKIQARKTTVDAYEAFYAVIDLCSADGSDITSPTADAKARRLIITDKVLEGSTYIYVADGIPASCMGNTIRVTFYGINADGTVDYRTLSDNSIAAKLYEFGATGDAEMNLAAALLNYGAAAQTNFGYNTANLVNASLAAELQKSSLADYSDTVLNGTRTIDELVEGETAVFTATKITGELLDKIVLNITLRPADTTNKDYSDLTFVCEYTDYLGAVQTVVIPSSEWNTSGSMPIVKLDRLSAANLRQKLTINIYSGYGTEAQSRVLKTHYLDGFEYTATTGQATSNPEALRVLYYSIMHYSDMAKAYLAQ